MLTYTEDLNICEHNTYGYNMTTVLSVRVRKSLKEEAEALGINIREVVEKALEEEIKKIKMERLKKIIDDALRSMDVSVEEWVNTVRESRLER